MLFSCLRQLAYGAKFTKFHKKMQVTFKNWSIFKGDQVVVRSGDDKGKRGKILKVFRNTNQVVVSGVRVRKSVVLSSRLTQKKVYRTRAGLIHVSKVGLYDPIAKRAVKVKFAYHPETNKRLRISRKTGVVLKQPNMAHMKRAVRGKRRILGIKDTRAELALKVTYQGEDFAQIKKEFEQFIREKERKERFLVFNE